MEDKTMKNVKKSFALLFAVIFAFSAMSVVASAVAPVVTVTEYGKTSVTVKQLDNCVYGWKAIGAEGGYDYSGGTSNVIELAGSTKGYEIVAKNFITDEVSTAVTVLAAPEKPVLKNSDYVSCTATTITMKANSNYQYKAFNKQLGFETEWSDSNTITGLVKDTEYSVIARNKVAENQLLGEDSNAILIRTTARDSFTGKKEDCRVDLAYTGSVPQGTSIKVTATGSYIDSASPSADTTPVEGDTRYVPRKWYAKQTDSGIIVDSGEWASDLTVKSDMVETTNVTVKKGSTVDVRVEVEFELQSYTNGKWVKKLGTVIDSNTFPVAPKAGSGQKVLQILTSVINLATKALLTFFKLINQFLTKAN
jgi:hypothetical protein